MTDTILPQAETQPDVRRYAGRRLPQPALAVGLAAVVLLVTAGGYELTTSHASARPSAPTAPDGRSAQVAPAASPQALLSAAMTNARAQTGVHIDSTTVTPDHRRISYSDDDGAANGVQRITVDGGEVMVRVVGSTTYFTGDPAPLTTYMGMTPSEAASLQGRWLALTASNPDYVTVTQGVTLESSLDEIGLTGSLRQLLPATKDGQSVVGLQGIPSGSDVPEDASATLWVTTGNDPLPVEYDASGQGASFTAVFSHWGEPVMVAAPDGQSLIG